MKLCVMSGKCPSEINENNIPYAIKKKKQDRLMRQFPVHFLKEIDDITDYICQTYGEDRRLRDMMCTFIRDTADYISFLKDPYE